MFDALLILLVIGLTVLSGELSMRALHITHLRKAGVPGLTGKLVWTFIALYLSLQGTAISLLFLFK